MRKIWILLLVLSAFPLFPFCSTYESDQMTDLLQYVNGETWVFCDVDNTLIESGIHLGSPQWRAYILSKAKQAGYNSQEAEQVLDKFWLFVQHFIPMQAVDPKASEVTKKLCESTAAVLALTAREPIEASYTSKQLVTADISLFQGQLCEAFDLPLKHPSSYQNGVIYCGDNKKGETLIAFFRTIGCLPKRIVFIDDKWEQVLEVEECMKQLGIEFVGIRFSRADNRVNSFKPAIADLQWARLPQILSDHEAQCIVAQDERTKPPQYSYH